MKIDSAARSLLTLIVLIGALYLRAQQSNGLAPEVVDLNAAAVSWAQEAKLPDWEKAFIRPAPTDKKEGIQVGVLRADGEDREAILKFPQEIKAGQHGEIDILLIAQHGKLRFESC